MFIASQKRKQNIAEYLLYMWQVEDLIRANGLNIDRIRENIVDKSGLDPSQRQQLEEWYESLIDMMRRENVEKSGHLQLNKNVIIQLVDLHNALLKDPRFPDYTRRFYAALPAIVDLRSKAGDNPNGEIETCFDALYGMLMMRLAGRQISPATESAVKSISQFIALLAHNFHLDEQGELFNNEDAES